MFTKLRNKFLLSNMILTLLVLLGTFAVLFSLVYQNARHDAEKKLLALPSCAEANILAAIPTAGSVVRYITDIVISGEHLGSSIFFKITVTSDGKISKSNPDYWHMEEAYKKAVQTTWKYRNIHKVISLGRTKWQAIAVPSSITDGEYDIFFMDVTSPQELQKNLLHIFLGICPLTLLAVFLISRKTANKAMQPITAAWEKQRQFVADASHELKTPLAAIIANTDALLVELEDNPEGRRKWIGYIKDETERTSRLVNELLYLAKVEDGNHHEQFSKFDFGQCISEACIRAEALIYEKSITLECDIKENVILESNEIKVRKLISILLDNAIKYTEKDGFIHIKLKINKSIAELSVENSGAGITADMLPNIFDRFYRADRARGNEDGSYGLGLAIAKNIAENLGAELTANSVPNQKTIFTFRLKVIN